MNLDQIQLQLNAYKENNQILDAANYIVDTFDLNSENFAGFEFRYELEEKSVLLTTEGALGEIQTVKIPRNLFDFDLNLVLNLLAHEMLHVRQKEFGKVVEDKNEREFQCYYEMLFHTNFPQIPDASTFFQKQFSEKAFTYYQRMSDNSELQLKYKSQKEEIEKLLGSQSNV
ncbi:hypothetical protein [Halpernia frigidisoli]|uniref:Uncharacterized protein n=1 Tax=Halpernia frigidisoli TaxID=1125876 RepID=A0A1I3GVV4_9FLAO|nr:hypothetical protein [Halpernia frigidisoli]SFI27698.1 hypothetical protein SAMN05443292_2055 [Halpernia frigidisoli]